MSGAAGAAATGRAPRVLIAGGGTGGHVYPGLAVAEALRAARPDVEVRWAGTRRGLEAVLVPRAGLRLHLVPASGFRGLGPLARLRFVANLGLGVARSLLLLARWRPDVVLGTGGFASLPVLMAARLRGLPTALQEQNSIPGSTNRLLGRGARRIYLGFAAAAAHFPAGRCLATGNPVRAAFAGAGGRGRQDTAAAGQDGPPPRPASEGDGLRLLVFGGSRGARTLNRAVREAAAAWRERPELALWLQTGPAEVEEVGAAYAGFPAGRARVAAYLFDMPGALAWADLVVCRAGAMTLAELAAAGRPSLLVPFPHATDDHQTANARDWERAGAAVVLADAACDGTALTAAVAALAADRSRLRAMGRAAAALAAPEAAGRIAADLLTLAAGTAPAAAPGED